MGFVPPASARAGDQAPRGTSIVLGGLLGGTYVWDDETNPTPGPGSLTDFEGESAAGAWTVIATPYGPGSLQLDRLNLRLTPDE